MKQYEQDAARKMHAAAGRDARAPLLILILALLLPACAGIQSGSDPIVVNAERTTAVAVEVFDTFSTIEFEHREALAKVSPAIRAYADHVRENAPLWLGTTRSLTKAYKTNRTPENKASLLTAIAILNTGITESQKYLLKATKP